MKHLIISAFILMFATTAWGADVPAAAADAAADKASTSMTDAAMDQGKDMAKDMANDAADKGAEMAKSFLAIPSRVSTARTSPSEIKPSSP